MAKKNVALQVHQMTIKQFDAAFLDETACRSYLQANRWPNGVTCPRCGNPEIASHSTKEHHWTCVLCAEQTNYRFSVLVGTIFENTNKPLRDWFKVMHMMLTSKKGISALQVYRVMGFGSYNTALLMCNKIRVALGDEEFKQLVGYVEVDETFVGGKAKNKHRNKPPPGGQGRVGKAIVAGAVQRKGNVIARVIENTRIETIEAFVRHTVSIGANLLSTDEFPAYNHLTEYHRAHVTHSKGEYVHGLIHTNTIEGFWSMVKRGIMGTFHNVSKKHLQLYVNEFEFRYNNRKNLDIFGTAIRAC